jgi:hypothetical protein
MSNTIGRGSGGSPTTEFVKLSGSTASSPVIAITATTAAGTTIHTADLNAQDVLYVQVFNNSAATLVAYGQLGSTATTASLPLSLTTETSGFVFNAVPISSSGVATIWTTASTGLVAIGSVQRTYV